MRRLLCFIYGLSLGILIAIILHGCAAAPTAIRSSVPPEVEVSLSRQEFWLAIISAIGAVVSSIILGVVNLIKLKSVHLDLNSRLGEMLTNRLAEGRAQGELDARSPRPPSMIVLPPNPLDTIKE